MIQIAQDLPDDEVLAIVFETIDLLARGDFDSFAEKVGYSFAFGAPPAECVRAAVRNYRSPEWFPGVERFEVTDWSVAAGGNPEPRKEVIWYEPNEILGGAVTVDLPLNGRWSDLQADFVIFDHGHGEPFILRLEEIYSFRQRNRDDGVHATPAESRRSRAGDDAGIHREP